MGEQALRERLAAIEAQLRAIDAEAGDAAFTEDQETRFTALVAERGQVERDLAGFERRRTTVASLATRTESTEPGDGATRTAPAVVVRRDPFDAEVRSYTRTEARDNALRVLDDAVSTDHLEDRQKRHVERLIRSGRTRNLNPDLIARQILLTENPHYRSAFVKLVTRTAPVLTADEARAVEAFEEFRAMSIGTDAAGGFGVPVLIDPTIVLTAQGSPNDIINLARVETITNDEWKGVSSAGVSWSHDAEAAAVSDDAPTLAQPNVVVHKAQGFIPYSIEVGMDYPGFASEMSTLLSEGYLELVAEMLTTGTGSGQPFGIVTALDANTNVEVTPTTDGSFGAVDLYRLWDALPIRYRRRGSVAWMSSTDVQNEVRNFGTTLGSNFTVDLTQEDLPRMFGRQYYQNDFMADFTGSTGAVNLLVVGDWQNYLVAQRAGMSVELVPHLFDVTANRPTGQRGWYAWARYGADSINDLGFRLLQNQ